MGNELVQQAEKILLDCAVQYYIASGLVRLDEQDGYGPLREARLWIERNGSDKSKSELEKWRRPAAGQPVGKMP